jgi:DNA-binding transcriptional ArsR family regulator
MALPIREGLAEQDAARARALFFQSLASYNRQKILGLLIERACSVKEIQHLLGLDQSTVSHSLKCLAFCGLVNAVRRGKNKVYAVEKDYVRTLIEIADKHISLYATNLFKCDVLER